ncbi:TMV resistance protein N-like [Prosopis cineraria]|uniref:TMV resistance protein N-like n=1 Tax=Prosopis cineraria TaxID=364024 RepID=UPI00240FCE42|nr:TMV resistance protein N-like [Prosopis cineraria]
MDAIVEAACSSSSLNSKIQPWKHHVFLSFRGEDTRKGFTAHLHDALQRRGIITFIDDELQRGDVISLQLLRAIEDSLISIVILSQNYASSSWCLDELQKILESRESLKRDVIPVFYNIDPSDARHQIGAFADSFTKHFERYSKEKEKVEGWRHALKEVANISGYHSADQLEPKLIEEIVTSVWTKLQPHMSYCYKTELVGMESRIEEVNAILEIGLNDVRFLGIWGMGGIGKTSLARAIYEINCNHFDLYYFFANVRDVCQKEGCVPLQRKFVSRCGKLRSIEFDDEYEGMKIIRSLLFNQKVLIVLDDVSEMNQLKYLGMKSTWLGPGSRVIVTTRDKQLLATHGEFETYSAKLLNNEESLQLFCQRAFKSDKPTQDYLELSKSVVQLAGGLPLTLEVLGCHLYGATIAEWRDALEKIKKCPPSDIINVLRVSYEALDNMEKKIFLDIACFFKGMCKDELIRILEICDFHPTIGIKRLVEKSLLVIGRRDKVNMHDILQEMGKYIVFEESPANVGRRSRLWSTENINHVLKNNEGTNLIEVIYLDSPMQYEASWAPDAFSKMSNLRILIISCDVHLLHGLKCLPSSLKVLEWKKYPLKYIPIDVQLHELVYLQMHHSTLIEPWKKTPMLEKLKLIDLSYSEDLIQTPNFSMLSNLEHLILEGCIKLVEVHPSLGYHKKIVEVNLRDCKNLKAIPGKVEMDSLRTLILSGCSRVKRLPEFGENMKCLSMLELKDCKNVICLPSSLRNLKSLKNLNISGCSKMVSLPNNLEENKGIEELDVSGTAIREIPSCVVGLKHLRTLNANGCRGFSHDSSKNLLSPIVNMLGFNRYESALSLMLPPSISTLCSLRELNLSYCSLSVESIPNDLGCLPSLKLLDLSGNDFSHLPSGSCILPLLFSGLSSLKYLGLKDCNLYDGSLPDDLRSLSSLEVLDLGRNKFTTLPSGFVSNILALRSLTLDSCTRLLSLPVVPPNVGYISAIGCHSLMEPSSFLGFLSSSYYFSNRPSTGIPYPIRYISLGSEIPPWFHNQNIDFLAEIEVSSTERVYQSRQFAMDKENIGSFQFHCIVSIKADLSRFRGSSEQWGISLCFVLQDIVPTNARNLDHRLAIYYGYETDRDNLIRKKYDWGFSWETYLEAYDPHLCIVFIPSGFLPKEYNQVELIFTTARFWPRSRGLVLIRKCGWRVTSKEDIEEWQRSKNASMLQIP